MTLDLLCAGRACVDLYAEQENSPLAEVESFRKYLGGSAANISVGAARLGLRTGIMTRVGAEQFGTFVTGALKAEGVDVTAVQVDPVRPTSLVALAIRPVDDFPRIFFYHDSADLAFDPDLVDLEWVSQARAALVTGSYLINESLAGFSIQIASAVRSTRGRVVLDLDFRPVLWGTVPIGQGNNMSECGAGVAVPYRRVFPFCDLIVGTVEEFLASTGKEDIRTALVELRGQTPATLVVKAGADGATAYDREIPRLLADGIRGSGYDVEALNSVGAGDAFMAGFLSGWLRNRELTTCIQLGNAAGAIVATRHGCTPAMPVSGELNRFVSLGGVRFPDADKQIAILHRSHARTSPDRLFVLAVDHRWQLEALAEEVGVPTDRLKALKHLFAKSFMTVASQCADTGVLIDDQYGAAVLAELTGTGVWIRERWTSLGLARSPFWQVTRSKLGFTNGRSIMSPSSWFTLIRATRSRLQKCRSKGCSGSRVPVATQGAIFLSS